MGRLKELPGAAGVLGTRWRVWHVHVKRRTQAERAHERLPLGARHAEASSSPMNTWSRIARDSFAKRQFIPRGTYLQPEFETEYPLPVDSGWKYLPRGVNCLL